MADGFLHILGMCAADVEQVRAVKNHFEAVGADFIHDAACVLRRINDIGGFGLDGEDNPAALGEFHGALDGIEHIVPRGGGMILRGIRPEVFLESCAGAKGDILCPKNFGSFGQQGKSSDALAADIPVRMRHIERPVDDLDRDGITVSAPCGGIQRGRRNAVGNLDPSGRGKFALPDGRKRKLRTHESQLLHPSEQPVGGKRCLSRNFKIGRTDSSSHSLKVLLFWCFSSLYHRDGGSARGNAFPRKNTHRPESPGHILCNLAEFRQIRIIPNCFYRKKLYPANSFLLFTNGVICDIIMSYRQKIP